MKIALIGNPNSGKTSLFNQLTGASQRVGNWSGVTVDKKTGHFSLKNDQKVDVVDLPGVYSLSVITDASSLDEQIACDFVLSGDFDVIINIVDASNLARNLYLTMQLLEMQVPMVVALSMEDIAHSKGSSIDHDALSQLLGCPVVGINGRKSRGSKALKEQLLEGGQIGHPVVYSADIEKSLGQLVCLLVKHGWLNNPRWLAVRLLERDLCARSIADEHDDISTAIESIEADITSPDVALASQRYRNIAEISDKVINQFKTTRARLTDVVDAVALNRVLGIPIFLLIMYLMFEFSITIGGALQPLFDQGSRTIFIDGGMYLGYELGLPTWFSAVVGQGVGLGINTVLTFIPQIGAMFLFLSLIEDSGYMARAAFVMDRLMQKVGLPGKAFVPLIVGFGCNVPSIMATRTLESHRDRLVTILMAPFMSCGARLAIFAVFSSAFFPKGGALIVFLLYITGIVVAILTGLLLKKTVLKGKNAPFVMELPPYHLPTMRTLWLTTWQRLKRFIFRAGKVIIPICLLVGSLNTILPNGHVVAEGSRHSILSYTGRAITPVLAPMGIDQENWPATVGLITGGLAKEVVVGTLNTLYTQRKKIEYNPQSYHFFGGLEEAVDQTVDSFKSMTLSSFSNPFTANEAEHHIDKTAMGHMVVSFGSGLAAFVYMLFVLLYVPCASTVAITVREAGKAFGVISTIWSLSIAYAVAVIVYQGATLMAHPLSSSFWVIGLIAYLYFFLFALNKYADKVKLADQSFKRRCPVACKGCR